MRVVGTAFAAAICCASAPALAIEGSSAAGPIGGTDMRSSIPLPPGLYGGAVALAAFAHQFNDGNGNLVPALSGLDLSRTRVGPFLIYVPDVKLFGGTIELAGIVPAGTECGHLFEATPKRCVAGLGDPYVEVGWSRFFGTPRPSRYSGAYPIFEGLAISFGFGMVVPVGKYDVVDATTQGISIGNNIWDFAPIVGFTYTTKPILAEGTEVTARLFWNNYLTNPATQYATGTLLNVDFAATEHIGRFQLGLAGFYTTQVADDRQFGVPLLPDGRQTRVLDLGGVLVCDMPEYASSMKIKALRTVISENNVNAWGVVVGWIRKFH
jgi:hypothetical protein